MIKRVRDKLRNWRVQDVIAFEEWSDIESRYAEAASFIKEENQAYQILLAELREAESIILDNRVHEVREVRFISELMQKVFVIPKEEQLNELVGQIKFIRGYLAELQSWIDRKLQLEKEEADGRIIIRRNKEEPIDEQS